MRINIRRVARLRCGSIIDEIRLGAVDFTAATALCKSAVAAIESVVPEVIRFTRLMQPSRRGTTAQIITLTSSGRVYGKKAFANHVSVARTPALDSITMRRLANV